MWQSGGLSSGSLAVLAAYDQAWIVALLLAFVSVATGLIALADCAKAMQSWRDAIENMLPQKTIHGWGFARVEESDS